jgi:hypothetical protein
MRAAYITAFSNCELMRIAERTEIGRLVRAASERSVTTGSGTTSTHSRRVSFDLLNFYHRRLSLFGVDSR